LQHRRRRVLLRRTLLVALSKSGKPRAIALNAQTLELLRGIAGVDGNPYIFPSEVTGRPSASLYFPWDRIRQRAGLYSLRLHDLRHSFTSFLVNQGVSLSVVQGLLGHSHARTTQRYAHLAQETLLDAAQLVGTIVAGGCGNPHPEAADAGIDALLSAQNRSDPADTEQAVALDATAITSRHHESRTDSKMLS
jgi:hypothetical protein